VKATFVISCPSAREARRLGHPEVARPAIVEHPRHAPAARRGHEFAREGRSEQLVDRERRALLRGGMRGPAGEQREGGETSQHDSGTR
jgi:hypothetical protein